MLDLVILVADKDMEFALRGLLTRHKSIGFHPLPDDKVKIIRYSAHDSGCRARGYELLREFGKLSSHALMLFDREGCGREDPSRIELEIEVEEHLSQSGWGNNAKAIVIDPELDIWVWSNSPHVDRILGWHGRSPCLREWLTTKGHFSEQNQVKPDRPKETLEAALRAVHKPRSSALYGKLAQIVGLARCVDPAFLKFKQTMQLWFPPEAGN